MLIAIKYERHCLPFGDRRNWTAYYPSGEAFDYGSLEYLKKSVTEEGYRYKILRCCKDGSIKILETSTT